MKPLFIALALLIGSLAAQGAAHELSPSAKLILSQIYENRTGIDRYRFNDYLPHKSDMEKLDESDSALMRKLKTLDPELFSVNEPVAHTIKIDKISEQREDLFRVHALEPFAFSESEPTAFYIMESSRTKNYRLNLQNSVTDDTKKRQTLRAHISCNHPYILNIGLRNLHKNAGETVDFKFQNRRMNIDKYELIPSDDTSSCVFTFEGIKSDSGKKYGVRFIPDQEKSAAFEHLRQAVEVCSLPSTKNLSGPQAFFLSGKYRQLTCPTDVPLVEQLEEGKEGFVDHIEALTGQKISEQVLKDQNPYIKLDFSKAPKLDLIIVSYLVFKSDMSGQLTAQALKWHADHGTQVRILTAEVLQEEKDKKMLYDLAASNGNIKAVEYKYFVQAKSGSFLDFLHRTNHTKILLTYSSTQENANQVYLGGRNIHDGFLYREAPKHKFSELVNYQDTDEEFYSYWRDFEVKIVSKHFTEQVASHFFTLWDEEGKSQFVRSYTLDIPSDAATAEKYFSKEYLIRHLISIPFKDDQQLETFFSDMIDSAQHTILLSTPYFRPTNVVQESLKRAIKRGVKITLITRLDLKGDMVDWILSDVNKDGVNQFQDQIKAFEYTEPSVILHSKLVMIDSEMTLLGSVNLNKRSFVHDTENATLVYSPVFTQKMEKLYSVYMEKSKPIKEEIPISFLKKIIIFIFDDKF